MESIRHDLPISRTGIEKTLLRIQGEFQEMPGLRLTCRQAQRLWNLDPLVCKSLLAALVDVRFLVECDGVFAQRTEPRRVVPALRRT
jgi:hypothetical protein